MLKTAPDHLLSDLVSDGVAQGHPSRRSSASEPVTDPPAKPDREDNLDGPQLFVLCLIIIVMMLVTTFCPFSNDHSSRSIITAGKKRHDC